MKRSLIALFLREMQIQTTMCHCSTLHRMALADNTKWIRLQDNWILRYCWKECSWIVAQPMTQQCHWDAENVPLLDLDGGLAVHYICDHSWRYTFRMYALFWMYIYFNSNVYFKQTKKVKQYHCITKAIIHTHFVPRFLLLEPLSSLCFLLIKVIFSFFKN